jgi:hypothetical protein
MSRNRVTRRTALAVVVGVLLAACSSPAGQAAEFTGYKWAVVSISHDGETTPIPGSYQVYLQFAPDGHFGANEPVNYHSGNYRVTPDGFTTSGLVSTAAGYAGRDPVVLLSVSAISAFNDDVRAQASVSGGALTVVVGGYTLVTRVDGKQANF